MTVGIKIRAMRHVLIPTDHLEATGRFYVDVLGLERFRPRDTREDFQLDWVRQGDVELHIVKRDPELGSRFDRFGKFNPTLQPHIGFEIENYRVAKEAIQERAIEVLSESGPQVGVIGRAQMMVRDPSGLVVELYEEGYS